MLLRCYPRITDWIYHFFNQSPAADYRFLPFYSYGFFVATGFFAAASLAMMEMKRRENLGLLKGVESEITEGEPAKISDLAITFILSFTVFFKLVGIFTYHNLLQSHQLEFGRYMLAEPNADILSKILSVYKYGSWVGGVVAAIFFTAYLYYSRNKAKLNPPVVKKITIFPSDSIGDLVVIAAVLGILGSVLFNYLENPGAYEHFWADPIGSLFSGLSVYGGLICAGIGFAIYARTKKFNLAHFFDSVAPGFMLANGIGRLGCQVAGDGDWGIANLHPKPEGIPQFLWSSIYENNIIDADPNNILPNCAEEHCHFLSQAVYPTPVYEFLMCVAVFFILWSIRKRLTP